MLNFGLTDMRLVNPRDGWPNPSAGPAASGADIVLERARVFENAEAAIADCSTIYASTVRRRDLIMPVLTPEAMAGDIACSATPSAILFGAERSGLETEEVALANAIVTVPINPDFGSLNLAQAVILLAYLALGSLMEAFAVMVITVPIVTPLVLSLGYDIVWWGIIMMMVVEVGMIHPPLGLNVFVLKSITPDIPIWTIYKGVLPFCVADLIKLILMVLIPAITLWLPSTMIH